MKLLIVVDMQKDFIDGSLGTTEARTIVPNVLAKIAAYPPEAIFVTRDTHAADYLTSCGGGSPRSYSGQTDLRFDGTGRTAARPGRG